MRQIQKVWEEMHLACSKRRDLRGLGEAVPWKAYLTHTRSSWYCRRSWCRKYSSSSKGTLIPWSIKMMPSIKISWLWEGLWKFQKQYLTLKSFRSWVPDDDINKKMLRRGAQYCEQACRIVPAGKFYRAQPMQIWETVKRSGLASYRRPLPAARPPSPSSQKCKSSLISC